MVLPISFFEGTEVNLIAKELLGKVLVTCIEGHETAGIIVETEAYAGVTDRASHAWNGRRTASTEVMYASGGHAYVYLCYGIHYLFNIVTNVADVPHAILIRALEPLDGIETMLQRRGFTGLKPALTAGPGAMSRAMGIGMSQNGVLLHEGSVWVEDRGLPVGEQELIATTRVGVAYADADALLPFRYLIKGNRYVSKAKGL